MIEKSYKALVKN